MNFIYKMLKAFLIGLLILSIPFELYLLVLLALGLLFVLIILAVVSGKAEQYIFKKPHRFNDRVLRFNDIESTEIYVTDIRSCRSTLMLDKGYVIDVVNVSDIGSAGLTTLRYGSRSERDKDYRALTYKLKEYGLYWGRIPNEQSE